MPNAIIQAGSLNAAATLVAGVYTVIVPPPKTLQGAPTDICGYVGVGSWGPVGLPVAVGDPSSAVSGFGAQAVRKHDLVSAVAFGSLQGAQAFRLVRVTDGTDAHASVTLSAADLAAATVFWSAVAAALNSGSGVQRGASGLVRFDATSGTFSALYTGVVGNGVVVSVSKGSKVGSFRVVVSAPGRQSEVFDNLLPDPAHLPNAAAHALSGGTDGDTGVTSAMLVGSDVAPRTGMYALRSQGCAAMAIVDLDDATEWSVQVPFCLAEGIQGYVAGPSGESLGDASAMKAAAGIDDYGVVVLHGDYVYWNDNVNGVIRLMSPATALAAKRAALAPNESTLNKPLYGIVGSQKSGMVGSGALVSYTSAEIEALVLAGISVIGNPAPGGSYWADLVGHNSSSDAERQSDTYTAMTNFLARTINGGMGGYVGEPNSLPKLRRIAATVRSLFASAQAAGLLGDDTADVPYTVVCSEANNPTARRGIGYTQADCEVRYQGVTEKLLVNLQGGATVEVGGSTSAS